jgi:hypothetical protein
MSSRIEFITIDESYPVAGQDNNSQGFRDNFDIIKKSLSTASEEVSDLLENSARKDSENKFAGNTIEGANLKNVSYQVATGEGLRNIPDTDDEENALGAWNPNIPYDTNDIVEYAGNTYKAKRSVPSGNLPTDTNFWRLYNQNPDIHYVDCREGRYFAYSVNDDVDLVFINWPGSTDNLADNQNYASIIVELRPGEPGGFRATPLPYDVRFSTAGENEIKKGPSFAWLPPANNEQYNPTTLYTRIGSSDLYVDGTIPDDIKVDVFEFWSYDGGKTVFAKHLGTFDVNSPPSQGSGGLTQVDFLNNIGDVEATGAEEGDLIIFKEGDPFADPPTFNRWEATTDGVKFKGNILDDTGAVMVNHNTNIFTGDLDGSVIGSSSTLLVDAVNDRLNGDVYGGLVVADYVNLNAFATNTARDDVIPSPTGGEIAFVADAGGNGAELQGFDGSTWVNMLGGGAGLTIWTRTANFDINSTSPGVYYRVASEDNVLVTVPLDITANIPVGSTVTFIQTGAGGVVIDPIDGVTVNSADGFLKTRTVYSAMTITKIGANEWDLYGDLSVIAFLCAVDWETLGADQYADKSVSIAMGADMFTGTLPIFRFASGGAGGESSQDGFVSSDPTDAELGGLEGVTWQFVAVNADNSPPWIACAGSASQATVAAELFLSVLTGDQGSDGSEYWTTDSTFVPDQIVIYFSFSDLSFAGGEPGTEPTDFNWYLYFRQPDNFSARGAPVQVATDIITLDRVSDASTTFVNPPSYQVFAVTFDNPGAFNSFAVDVPYGLGVCVHDLRLCKDGALMTWPLNSLVNSLVEVQT